MCKMYHLPAIPRLMALVDKIKLKLKSFKSIEHINEIGIGHTAILATEASSLTFKFGKM